LLNRYTTRAVPLQANTGIERLARPSLKTSTHDLLSIPAGPTSSSAEANLLDDE